MNGFVFVFVVEIWNFKDVSGRKNDVFFDVCSVQGFDGIGCCVFLCWSGVFLIEVFVELVELGGCFGGLNVEMVVGVV